MNPYRKTFLIVGFLAVVSVSALAVRCNCVTLGDDACGVCPGSGCDARCALHVDSKQMGWDQMLPGFFTQQFRQKLVVAEVLPDSPAEHAGMRVGDELIAVDGMRVPLCRTEAATWQSVSSEHSVVVRRGKGNLTLEISPIRLSAMLQRSLAPTLQNVSVNGRAQLPAWSPFFSGLVLSWTGKRATVVSVLSGSSAAENGIWPGDVVLSSDGEDVTDLRPIEGADYRAKLTLRVSGHSGERTIHLSMNSAAEILQDRSHNANKPRIASQGF
jgi:predicted metalloprotease with PDZ domain